MTSTTATPMATRPADAELVFAAGRGDTAAFGLLLEGHRARLTRLALALLGDPQDAADAVQDTFLTALRRLSELRDPAAFGSWLARIQRNVCLMRLRAAREIPAEDVTTQLDRAQPMPSAEECVERLALRDWVWQALGELPEPLRVTAMLRYFGRQHSYQEIAEITGVPVGTVRSRLHQLRAVLANRLLDEAAPSSSSSRDAAGQWARSLQDAFEAFNQRSDPGPLAALYSTDVKARLFQGPQLRGRDELQSLLLEDDLADGVGYRLTSVVASGDLAVVEVRFLNPPADPFHCPPAFTQVLHHRGFQAHRMTAYFAARPDGDPNRENG
ncbi:sigma-70 family RNA polymerase sigma factor [Streptacidiphilus sp. N1-12]|uniref:Sigma-70 family RNA polymerase sigma factor n=2 Tax=Streptacidiphilus alkalitolerans TaxID=3342712 RepID=A0ABV6VGZ1_9ACTN